MMAPLAKIFGGIAAVLVTFMLIGLVLPGTWSAEASVEIEAVPTEVFPYLNDLSRWDTWTNWGDIESELSDPPRSVGASRSWDDPNFGSGSVTITSSLITCCTLSRSPVACLIEPKQLSMVSLAAS